MKVQKYFMRTRMHGTPTGRPDYWLWNWLQTVRFFVTFDFQVK